MLIENKSENTICVGETLEGPPAMEAMIMKPGAKLFIEETLPGLHVVFVSTPGGLRVAIRQQGLIVPGGGNGHAGRLR